MPLRGWLQAMQCVKLDDGRSGPPKGAPLRWSSDGAELGDDEQIEVEAVPGTRSPHPPPPLLSPPLEIAPDRSGPALHPHTHARDLPTRHPFDPGVFGWSGATTRLDHSRPTSHTGRRRGWRKWRCAQTPEKRSAPRGVGSGARSLCAPPSQTCRRQRVCRPLVLHGAGTLGATDAAL